MAEDASLDDFLSATDDGTDQSETAPGTPTPATTTHAWDGDETACGSCGEAVERRWQQDGTLVCSACKDWSE